jgi:rhomboid family GlyGly-CTERM serine protease
MSAALATLPCEKQIFTESPMTPMQKNISKSLPVYLFLVLTGALSLFGEVPVRLLEFNRIAIFSGEYHRLLTGHFVHLGPAHAFMDLAAALMLWIWFGETLSLRGWLFSLVACGLFISLMLLAFTEIEWYVGLSGILHGVLLLGALQKRSFPLTIRVLILGVLALKIGVEQFHGASPQTVAMIGGEVVTDAHLFGALFGFVIWGFCAFLKKNGSVPKNGPGLG